MIDTAAKTSIFTTRRVAVIAVGLLVFLTAGYVQNSRPGDNANSMFDLTCAIVEQHTFRIDAYHDNPQHGELRTFDKSVFQGHYYCDKSPVTAFLGVPVFWIYRTIHCGVLGRPMDYNAARYWTTWWVCGLASGLLAVMTAVLLMRRGVAPAPSAAAAALWIMATPLGPYSVLFFPYLTACALLLGGYLLIEHLWSDGGAGSEKNIMSLRTETTFLLAGLLVGLAVWALNTLAIAALGLTIGILVAPASGWGERLRRFAPWAVGGALGAVGNFLYTHAIFGTWLTQYQYVNDPFFHTKMAQGLMGATRPRLYVAWLLLFHPCQGFLLWFPLITAAVGGLIFSLFVPPGKSPRTRSPLARRIEPLMILTILAGFVIFNSAYFMWWGGANYAPRHLIPTLPLLALGLVPWLTAPGRLGTGLLFLIGLIGTFANLPAYALNPQHPIRIDKEILLQPESVTEWTYPVHELNIAFWKMGITDHNWGQALGFKGPASLLPLLVIWVVVFWLIMREPANWRREP